MKKAAFLASIILAPLPLHAEVVINEVAWMGTEASANAEWMELWNSGQTSIDLTGWKLEASNGSPSITLTGSIAAQGFFLLERSSDASVPSRTADQIYTGALSNSGATLVLTDAGGTLVDQVAGGTNWASIGGDNVTKQTAQRTVSGWKTAVGTPSVSNEGVAETLPTEDPQEAESVTASSTPTSVGGGGPPEYLPIPQLRLMVRMGKTAVVEAETAFSVSVYDAQARRRDDAEIAWSFGDGMRRTGASVLHQFYAPGEYVVVVRATTPDGGDVSREMIVTAVESVLKITAVTPKGITIFNPSTQSVDVSWWRLHVGDRDFKLPEYTQILGGHSITFASQVTGLVTLSSAELRYPGGEIAAAYPVLTLAAPAQPPAAPVSYKKVQKILPITSQAGLTYEAKEVITPTVAPQSAAVGGAFAASSTPATSSPLLSVLSSPWSYGFVGVLLIAGAAVMLL